MKFQLNTKAVQRVGIGLPATMLARAVSPSCLTVRVSAAANNLLLRLAWPRCPQAGRIARPIQISRTAPMKPEIR
jgi:hypothetical protein